MAVSDTASLPRDPDILIGIIADLRDENGKLRAMVETLKRTLFGARSEKLDADPAQLPLALDDVSAAPRAPEPERVTRPRRAQSPSRKPARNIGGLPKHLPREDVVIEPEAEACPCCQAACGLLVASGREGALQRTCAEGPYRRAAARYRTWP